MIKIASMFDGIGGTPLCAVMCGAEPVWASEIEPFPIKVTKLRFPNMKHHGDITKINGADVEPVDIIVGGSPCQDLSLAGKRAGMKHYDTGDEEATRSGLFMEQIRIVKEMRNASKLRIERRHYSEMGIGSSADNKVAERGVCSNNGTNGTQPRFMVWENVPGAFSSNNGDDFRVVLEETARIADPAIRIPRPQDGWFNSGSILGDGFSISWRTVDAQYWGVPQRRRRIYLVADFGGQSAPEILFESEGMPWHFEKSGGKGQGTAGEVAGGFGDAITIDHVVTTGGKCTAQGPCWYEGYCPTLKASGVHAVLPFNTTQITSPQNGNNPDYGDPCHTLAATDHAPAICIQGSMIGRADKNGPQGDGINEDVAFTLNTTDRHAVAYGIDQQGGKGGANYTVNIAPTILSDSHGTPNAVAYGTSTVRRLTPLECERLQGYPDGWTDILGASDSPRYKSLGNSFAIPNALFVISGCIKTLKHQGK